MCLERILIKGNIEMKKTGISTNKSLFGKLSKAIICLVLSYLLIASPYLTLCAYSFSKDKSETVLKQEAVSEQVLNSAQKATDSNNLIGGGAGITEHSAGSLGSVLSLSSTAPEGVEQLSLEEVLENIFTELDASDISLNSDASDDADEINALAFKAYQKKASAIVSKTLNPGKTAGSAGYVAYDYTGAAYTTKDDVASQITTDVYDWCDSQTTQMGADESLLTTSTSATTTIVPVLQNIYGAGYSSAVSAETRAAVINSLNNHYGATIFKNQTRSQWGTQFNGNGFWSNYLITPTGTGTEANPYIVKSAGNWAWLCNNDYSISSGKTDVYIEFQNAAGYIDFGAHCFNISFSTYAETTYHINGNNIALTNLYDYNSSHIFYCRDGGDSKLILNNFVVASGSIYTSSEEASFINLQKDTSTAETFQLEMNNCIINIDNESKYTNFDKEHSIGGIVDGTQNGDTLSFENVINLTNISTSRKSGTSNYFKERGIGGFVGTVEEGSNVSFENCLNFGNITTASDSYSPNLGGFVGYVGNNFDGNNIESPANAVFSMRNCVNFGNIQNGAGNTEIATGGLVGKLTKDISSITFENNINKGAVKSDRGRVGGLIGYIGKNNTLNIKNCSNFGSVGEISTTNASINTNSSYGGILGYATSYVNLTLENCYNAGNASVYLAEARGGGLIGYYGPYGNLTINNALVNSNLEGYDGCLGGLIGYLASSANIIAVELGGYDVEVVNRSNDEYAPDYAKNSLGGFIGEINNSENTAGIEVNIVSSKMDAYVTHSSYLPMFVGGIVGYVHGNEAVELNILKTAVVKEIDAYGENDDCYLGGFIGFASGEISITECINDAYDGGMDTSQRDIDVNAGGFVGYLAGTNSAHTGVMSNLNITNSVNLSSIYYARRVGGFVGHADIESNLKIENCISGGYLNAGYYSSDPLPGIGGFVGYISNRANAEIEKVLTLNDGQVSISEYAYGRVNMGGIVGYVATEATLKIDNAINDKEISAYEGTGLGGILGASTTHSIVSISNVINTSMVTSHYIDVGMPDAEGADVGGIVGRLGRINFYLTDESGNNSYTTISNAINLGDVYAEISGGIVGRNIGDLKLNNSLNLGNIAHSINGAQDAHGGIIGETLQETIVELNSVINTGTIEKGQSVGGIIGRVFFGSDSHAQFYSHETNSWVYPTTHLSTTINNGYNFGTIRTTEVSGNNKSCAGGFIGYWACRTGNNEFEFLATNENLTYVSSSRNSWKLKDVVFEGLKMNYCVNNGEIECDFYVGGFGGSIEERVAFYGCENNGLIKGDFCVGGFVGYLRGVGGFNGNTIEFHLDDNYNYFDFDELYLVSFVNCINNSDINIDDNCHGGLCGMIEFTKTPYNVEIVIENCINNGSITGDQKLGGFVGNVHVESGFWGSSYHEYYASRSCNIAVNNSTNNGDVSGTGDYTGGFFGGLNCFTQGSITFSNSINNAQVVTGGYYVGGFIGVFDVANENYNFAVTVQNCENNADISVYCCAGGFVGEYESSQNGDGTNITFLIDGFINNGNITSVQFENGEMWWGDGAGGVIGYAYLDGFVTVRNCINNGAINGGYGSGGIIGYLYPDSSALLTVENCVNNGNICEQADLGYSDGHGGIIGVVADLRSGSVIKNCVNNGAVFGAYGSGGIFGCPGNDSVSLDIINNINNGKITALGQSGAILGRLYDYGENNNYTIGNISTAGVVIEGETVDCIIGLIQITDINSANYVVANNHIISDLQGDVDYFVSPSGIWYDSFSIDVELINSPVGALTIGNIPDSNSDGIVQESEWRGALDSALAKLKNNNRLTIEQFYETDSEAFVNLNASNFNGETFAGVADWKIGSGSAPYTLRSVQLGNKHVVNFYLGEATVDDEENFVKAQTITSDLQEIVLPSDGITQGVKQIVGWSLTRNGLVYFEQPENNTTTFGAIKTFFGVENFDEAVVTLYPVFDSAQFEVAWDESAVSEEMLLVDGEISGQTYFRGSQNPKLVSTLNGGASATFNGFYVLNSANSSWVYIANPAASAGGSFEFALNTWINSETIQLAQLTENGYKFTFKAVYDNTTHDVTLTLPVGGDVAITGSGTITEQTVVGISEGSSVSFTARPKTGYRFVRFDVYEGGAVLPTQYATVSISVVVNSALEVNAVFEAIPYEIITQKVDDDGNIINVGTINNYGESTVNIGDNVGKFVAKEVATSTSTKYKFDRWSIGASSKAIELDTSLSLTSASAGTFRNISFNGSTYYWFAFGKKYALQNVGGTSYVANIDMIINKNVQVYYSNVGYTYGVVSFVDVDGDGKLKPWIDIELTEWNGGDLTQNCIRTNQDGTLSWFNGASWVDVEVTGGTYDVARVNFVIESGVRYFIDHNNNGVLDTGNSLELSSFVLTSDIVSNYANANNQIIVRGVFNKQFYFTIQNRTPTYGGFELTYINEIGNTQTINSSVTGSNKIWLDEGKTVDVSVAANKGYRFKSAQGLETVGENSFTATLNASKDFRIEFEPISIGVTVIYKDTLNNIVDDSTEMVGYTVLDMGNNLIGENGLVQASNILQFKIDEFKEIPSFAFNRFLIQKNDGSGFDEIAYNEAELLSSKVSINEDFLDNYYFEAENCFKIKAEFIEVYSINLNVLNNNSGGTNLVVEITNKLGEFEEVELQNVYELKREQKIRVGAQVDKYYLFNGYKIVGDAFAPIIEDEATVEHQATSNASIQVDVERQVLKLDATLVGEYKGKLGALPETVQVGDEVIFEFNPDSNYEILDWTIGGTRVLDLENVVISGNSIKLTITEDFIDAYLKDDSVAFETNIQTMMNRTVFYAIVFIPIAIVILFFIVVAIVIVNLRNRRIRREVEKRIKDAETRFNFSSLVSDLKSGNNAKN